MCRDKETGAQVSWKGPKNRALGEKTSPQARTTMYGIQLIFNKIRKADAGIYICKTRTNSAEFELIVEGQIIFVDTPTEQDGKEGSDILLKCDAKDATTEWLVNGEPPKDDTKYQVIADGLIIKNASVEDSENEYICKAINIAAGVFQNRVITLIVRHPPRLKYERVEIEYGYIGEMINLTCEVLAQPAPTFRWFQKGEKYKLIGKEVHGPTPRVSILMLILRDNKDFGEYKCEVKNTEGTLEVLFPVINGTQPNPPTFMEITGASSSELFLTIEEPDPTEAENKTKMVPVGFRVEYRSKEEPQWIARSFPLTEDKTYTLTNLTKNTTYQVRAATENRAGFSEFTNTTEYTTSSAYIVSANLPYLFTMFSIVLILTSDLFHSLT